MPRAKEQRIDLHSSRATSRINPKLEKQLLMYLASASAAGVGLAALSNTAQAKVVYAG